MGYPGDVSDAEWEVIRSLLPEAKAGGRPRTTPLRHILNAVNYVSRSGCSWRMLPKDFLREQVREREGREASPSAAIIDSQSAKTTEKGDPRVRRREKDQGPEAAHHR